MLRDNDNYAWSDGSNGSLTYTFTIAPKQVEKPAPSQTAFEYTGEEITFIEGNEYYDVENGSGTDIGQYPVNVVLKGAGNQAWSDDGTFAYLTYTFNIIPKQVQKPAADTTAFTYSGSEQTYTLAENSAYTVTGNKQTEIGTYTVTVALNDKTHYQWADGSTDDLTYSFVIAKAKAPSSGSDDSGNTGGSGSGSSSAGSSNAGTGNTQTVQSGELDVTVTVSDNVATLGEISKEDIDKASGTAEEPVNAVIDLSGSEKEIKAVTLPAATLENLAAAANTEGSGICGVEIVLPGCSAVIDANALNALQSQAGGKELTLSLAVTDLTALSKTQLIAAERLSFPLLIEASFMADGKIISTFGSGNVTLTVPYDLPAGKAAKDIRAYYLNAKGMLTPMTCSYDAATGQVTIIAPHFSSYVISVDGDPCEGFTDTDRTAWYHNAVDFAVVNGLMSGYSETSFGPNDKLTRAQLVTILWRNAGSPVVNYAMSFTDVPAEGWYTEAVRWAASLGITDGYGNGLFGSADSITREQLAVFLYRYEQKVNGGGFTGTWMFDLKFSDKSNLSDWAYEPMCWCVMNGVLEGKGSGILDPKGTATRAQVAQMLMNYLGK
ncbi:MAG: S-layer homology domain-containing protein [Firmicutes bacterium]|nr:S-layer homology domain-containing protein [Bacillota bacterium]